MYADVQGLPACKLAEAGSYVDETGASATTPCEAGKFSGSAADECEPCNIGRFSGQGEPSCTSCPAGQTSEAEGAAECSDCPVLREYQSQVAVTPQLRGGSSVG